MKQSSPSRKEASRERIVGAAARAIRRHGYAGAGVADIMKEAGLTHGGFYAHFASREALLAAAADRAGAETVATLAQISAASGPNEALSSLFKAYLSDEHAAMVDTVCPVAALGSELSRQTPDVRHAATNQIKALIDLLSRQSPDWGQPEAHQRSLVSLATMVGALVISRAVDDPKLSTAMRAAALKHLTPNAI